MEENEKESINDLSQSYSQGVGRIRRNWTSDIFQISKETLDQREKAWSWLFDKYAEISDDCELSLLTLKPVEQVENVESNLSKCSNPLRKHPSQIQYWVDTGLPPCKATDRTDYHSDTTLSISEDELTRSSLASVGRVEKNTVSGKERAGTRSTYSSVDTAAYILSNTNTTKKAETMAIVEGSRTFAVNRHENNRGNRHVNTSPKEFSVRENERSEIPLMRMSCKDDNGKNFIQDTSTGKFGGRESKVCSANHSNGLSMNGPSSDVSTSFTKSSDFITCLHNHSYNIYPETMQYSNCAAIVNTNADYEGSPISGPKNMSLTKVLRSVRKSSRNVTRGNLSCGNEMAFDNRSPAKSTSIRESIELKVPHRPDHSDDVYPEITPHSNNPDILDTSTKCKESNTSALENMSLTKVLRSVRKSSKNDTHEIIPCGEEMKSQNCPPAYISPCAYVTRQKASSTNIHSSTICPGVASEPAGTEVLPIPSDISENLVNRNIMKGLGRRKLYTGRDSPVDVITPSDKGVHVLNTSFGRSSLHPALDSKPVTRKPRVVVRRTKLWRRTKARRASSSLLPISEVSHNHEANISQRSIEWNSHNGANDSQASLKDFAKSLGLLPIGSCSGLEPPEVSRTEHNLDSTMKDINVISDNCFIEKPSSASTRSQCTKQTTEIGSPVITKKQKSPISNASVVESSSLSVSDVSEIVEKGTLSVWKKISTGLPTSLNPFVKLERLSYNPSNNQQVDKPTESLLNVSKFDENGSIFKPLEDSVCETQEIRVQKILHAKKNLYNTELIRSTSSDSSDRIMSFVSDDCTDSDETNNTYVRKLMTESCYHRDTHSSDRGPITRSQYETQNNCGRVVHDKELDELGYSQAKRNSIESSVNTIWSCTSKNSDVTGTVFDKNIDSDISTILFEDVMTKKCEVKSPEEMKIVETAMTKTHRDRLNPVVLVDKLVLINGTPTPVEAENNLKRNVEEIDSKQLQPIIKLDKLPVVKDPLNASTVEKYAEQCQKRKKELNPPDSLEKPHSPKVAKKENPLMSGTNFIAEDPNKDYPSEQSISRKERGVLDHEAIEMYSSNVNSTDSTGRREEVLHFSSNSTQNAQQEVKDTSKQSRLAKRNDNCSTRDFKNLKKVYNTHERGKQFCSLLIMSSSDEESSLMQMIKNVKPKKTEGTINKLPSSNGEKKPRDQLYKDSTEGGDDKRLFGKENWKDNTIVSSGSGNEAVIVKTARPPNTHEKSGVTTRSSLQSLLKNENKVPVVVLQDCASKNLKPKPKIVKKSDLSTRSSQNSSAEKLKIIEKIEALKEPIVVIERVSRASEEDQLGNLLRDLTEDYDLDLMIKNYNKRLPDAPKTNTLIDKHTEDRDNDKSKLNRGNGQSNVKSSLRYYSETRLDAPKGQAVVFSSADSYRNSRCSADITKRHFPNRKSESFPRASDAKTKSNTLPPSRGRKKEPNRSNQKTETEPTPGPSVTITRENSMFTPSDEERFDNLQKVMTAPIREIGTSSRTSDTKALSTVRKTLFTSMDKEKIVNLPKSPKESYKSAISKPSTDIDKRKTEFFTHKNPERKTQVLPCVSSDVEIVDNRMNSVNRTNESLPNKEPSPIDNKRRTSQPKIRQTCLLTSDDESQEADFMFKVLHKKSRTKTDSSVIEKSDNHHSKIVFNNDGNASNSKKNIKEKYEPSINLFRSLDDSLEETVYVFSSKLEMNNTTKSRRNNTTVSKVLDSEDSSGNKEIPTALNASVENSKKRNRSSTKKKILFQTKWESDSDDY